MIGLLSTPLIISIFPKVPFGISGTKLTMYSLSLLFGKSGMSCQKESFFPSAFVGYTANSLFITSDVAIVVMPFVRAVLNDVSPSCTLLTVAVLWRGAQDRTSPAYCLRSSSAHAVLADASSVTAKNKAQLA